MTKDDVIGEFSEAIAQMEGYYLDPNTLSPRQRKGIHLIGGETSAKAYNNPGNIMGGWGTNRMDRNGYTMFPNKESGWWALKVQVSRNIERKLTFKEFFGGKKDVYLGYAPAGHSANNPDTYARFIVTRLNKVFRTSWKPSDVILTCAEALVARPSAR
jgi:hypothetical protein